MSQYIFILIWIMGMFLIKSTVVGGYRTEYILGKKEIRMPWSFAFLIFFPIIIMATFRGNMGDSLLSSKLQKNMSEKWLLFKKATFSDCIEGSFL